MEFFAGDIHDPAPGGPFDAVVERAVLMYVPDPAEVLRRQATVLRAGGLVVPIKIDFTTARALPASPLVNQAVAWQLPTGLALHCDRSRRLGRWAIAVVAIQLSLIGVLSRVPS